MLKAVILDFDGVLGDTEILQKRKWDILLQPYGITLGDEEYAVNYCGKSSTSYIPAAIREEYKIPLSVGEMASKSRDILEDLFANESISLIPNVIEALNYFRQQSLVLSVCSGKNQEELEMKLSRTGLSSWFEPNYRITQEDSAGKGKPSPLLYQAVLDKLNLRNSEAIAFEDTQSGVESASGAGIKTIALPNRFTMTHDFSKAFMVIDDGWRGVLERWDKIISCF